MSHTRKSRPEAALEAAIYRAARLYPGHTDQAVRARLAYISGYVNTDSRTLSELLFAILDPTLDGAVVLEAA